MSSSNKENKATMAAADRIKQAAMNASKGLSRAQAERAAAAAARNVNAYGQKEEGPSRWQERKEAKRMMYLESTEQAVKLGVRTQKGSQAHPGNQMCQKCYKTGHWTYECKNERVYVSRPSRTQQLKNPKLKARYMDAAEVLDGLDPRAQQREAMREEELGRESEKAKGERKEKKKSRKKKDFSESESASDSGDSSESESGSGVSSESDGSSDSDSYSESDSESDSESTETERRRRRRRRRAKESESESESESLSESDSGSDESDDSEDDRRKRKRQGRTQHSNRKKSEEKKPTKRRQRDADSGRETESENEDNEQRNGDKKRRR